MINHEMMAESEGVYTLRARVGRAGVKMEAMLVGRSQFKPHSMEFSLHFTPLFTAEIKDHAHN